MWWYNDDRQALVCFEKLQIFDSKDDACDFGLLRPSY